MGETSGCDLSGEFDVVFWGTGTDVENRTPHRTQKILYLIAYRYVPVAYVAYRTGR
jgi:hypothetical protein